MLHNWWVIFNAQCCFIFMCYYFDCKNKAFIITVEVAAAENTKPKQVSDK